LTLSVKASGRTASIVLNVDAEVEVVSVEMTDVVEGEVGAGAETLTVGHHDGTRDLHRMFPGLCPGVRH